MSKIIKGLLLALIVTILIGSPVLAYIYRAPLTVTESSGNTYPMLGANVSARISWLESNGFMGSNGTDTRVETLSGIDKPHMLATDRIMFATALGANSQENLYFTTGEPLLDDFYIIPGYGGNVTVADDPSIELGEYGAVTIYEVYIAATTDNGTIASITDALEIYFTSSNITGRIYDAVGATWVEVSTARVSGEHDISLSLEYR